MHLTVCMCAKSLQSCLIFCNPLDCTLPGSFSMGFSRQEYWSGLPLPSLRDLPFPGIKSSTLMTPALAGKLKSIFSGAAVREGILATDCQPEISFSMNSI